MQQWTVSYNGTASDNDVANAKCYVAGTSAGSSSGSDFVTIKYGPSTTGIAGEIDRSQIFSQEKFYLQNYPNPFKTSTKILFSIPSDDHVKLVIYDIQGKELSIPVNGKLKAGSYEVQWKADNLPAGSYYYKLSSGEFNGIGKMALIK